MVRHARAREKCDRDYLVGLVRSGRGLLALLARGKLGQVAVVVTLPALLSTSSPPECRTAHHIHLVVEDLGFTRLRLGDQGRVQNLEHTQKL